MTTLEFNVITFNHLPGDLTIHFSNQASPDALRIFKKLVPKEVLTHFGEQDHFFMDFEKPLENSIAITKSISPVFEKSPNASDRESNKILENRSFSNSIVRRFYNYKIFKYFRSKDILVKPTFVNDIEVWLYNKKEVDPKHWHFSKFSLKVQLAKLTNNPEILISYEGISKILKDPYRNLIPKINPDCFRWFLFQKQLYKFKDLPEEAIRNSEKVHVILNLKIAKALNYPALPPDRGNKYAKFQKNIAGFCKRHLFTEEFENIIPIKERTFLSVKETRIGKVSSSSNQLVFGNNQQGIIPYLGMKAYGPLEIPKDKQICFFYIYHQEDNAIFQKFDSFMEGKEQGFNGFQGFCRLGYYPAYNLNIIFSNRSNPLPEIEAALNEQQNFPPEIRFIAFYISPISKNTNDYQLKEIYFKVKEVLLKRKITSQALDHSRVFSNGFNFSLPNISIAVLAKLHGIPWRLSTTIKNELIVGVGAFKNAVTDTQYIGSAFSFTNTGAFNHMECFLKSQTDELAGSIIMAVRNFAALNTTIDRLIIHFYKNMSQEELRPIEEGLRRLDLNIPVYIISVNKTESQDIVAFDKNWQGLMPQSGTFINLGFNKFLLFNNTRYGDTLKASEGFPFPVKIGMYCTKEEKLKEPQVVQELLDQVYQFSRMYWKSVSQQNLPVTIKYPEMVAEIFSHFEGNEIPEFGRGNLWFL
ncbi:MAG: hypothetical protein LCH67_19760 [Bacteroidetes bacterium]|nr:hypothetical protein [Bacteroidota bacterium]